jgi:hypothetical protein
VCARETVCACVRVFLGVNVSAITGRESAQSGHVDGRDRVGAGDADALPRIRGVWESVHVYVFDCVT